MVVRRAASIFSMIGILAASSIATGPAAAAPASDIARKGTVVAGYLTLAGTAPAPDSQPEDVTTLSNCPILSTYCNAGAYICETTIVAAIWQFGGGEVVQDHVVIGTNFNIYTDQGTGWRRLDNGKANQFLPLNQIGLFTLNNGQTLAVIGTFHGRWRIAMGLFAHGWGDWHRCPA